MLTKVGVMLKVKAMLKSPVENDEFKTLVFSNMKGAQKCSMHGEST